MAISLSPGGKQARTIPRPVTLQFWSTAGSRRRSALLTILSLRRHRSLIDRVLSDTSLAYLLEDPADLPALSDRVGSHAGSGPQKRDQSEFDSINNKSPGSLDKGAKSMPLMLSLAIALAVLTALFAIQNAAVITVSFLIWEFEASLALVLILTLGVGVLIGYLATLPASWRKSSELRQTRRRQSELETMVRKDAEPEARQIAAKPGSENDSGTEETSRKGIE